MGIDDVASSDTPQHELAMKQLYMPIDMGGGGLRRADDRRYIAFLAAHIGALVESPVQWATINGEHHQSYSEMLEIITECIDNIRAQFMASPTGEHDEENAIRSKHIEELDRLLLIPGFQTIPTRRSNSRHCYSSTAATNGLYPANIIYKLH
jgi:hypothetical protein